MLRLAYFADDFTGATDALGSLALAGLRTRLFLDAPAPAQCAGLDAVGVAGLTRSLAPDAMEAVLRSAFTALRGLRPRHVHYKVCSTFDSSPTVGSIGRAIETGRAVFGGTVVPLLVAAPALGRYCLFGNLYARYGIGSNGAIYRLDRHPATSTHPVTPMTEADLRLHLARQTPLRAGLVDLTIVESGSEAIHQAVLGQVKDGADVVLFDALTDAHLRSIGAVLDRLAATSAPLFSVGSSGLGTALAEGCRAGSPNPALGKGVAGSGDPALQSPLLILSGSCSPVTAGQIDRALADGFTGIEYSPDALGAVVAALKSGRPTLVFTSRGQAGPAIPACELGTALGRLAREAITATGIRRLILAGGDTASYAVRALGLESVEMLAPLTPGAPWCRSHAPGSPADGLALNFKGGQVGSPDYFVAAQG